jgi:hypothetical protein
LEPTPTSADDRRWPRIIALGLAFVVLVNLIFAYLAVHGADTIVRSYSTEAR